MEINIIYQTPVCLIHRFLQNIYMKISLLKTMQLIGSDKDTLV